MLYAGPSVGQLKVSTDRPGQKVRWKVITLNLPFYLVGNTPVGVETPVLFGLPSPYVEFFVMPPSSGLFMAG